MRLSSCHFLYSFVNSFREDLERSLSLIKACVAGSAINLPMLEGDLVPVVESLVDFAHFTYQIVPTNVKR